MAKKDKKKNKDPEKKLALQLKKEAKASKAAQKRLTKQQSRELRDASVLSAAASGSGVTDTAAAATAIGGAEADDLDSLLASYAKRDAELTTSVVELCKGFPSPPRANFTLTTVPGGELYMFGGEYYNGMENIVFDELYRWDPDVKKQEDDGDDEGKELSVDDKEAALVTENGPSESIHQGEWKRISTPPPHPPARCSHTALHHSSSLYVFGGELATADQYHHYRDLWRFDIKTLRWEEIPCQGGPSPRSGHRAILWRHYMILFGGFYEALKETRFYNDLWIFDFQTLRWREMTYSTLATKPEPRSGCAFVLNPGGDVAFVSGGYSKIKTVGSKAEGKVHTDTWALHLKGLLSGKVPTWERVSRRGEYPSSRSGMGCVAYKGKVLVFGGVSDDEMDGHKVASVFYDELFGLDMDRRRWFKLGLKKGGGGGGRRRRKKAEDTEEDGAVVQELEAEEDVVDFEEEEEGKEGEAESSGWDLDMLKSNMFAYIDGEGKIVYEKIEPDEDKNDEEEAKEGQKIGVDEDEDEEKDEEKEESKTEEAAESYKPKAQNDDLATKPHPPAVGNSSMPHIAATATVPPTTAAPSPFERTTPLPRINPSLAIRSNTLYLYGGLLEVGDREVTLDDVWTLDLVKRDKWTCITKGTMHRQVWKGGNDDDSASVSTGVASSGGMMDLDEEDDDVSDEEEEEEETKVEDEAAAAAAGRDDEKKAKKKKKKSKRSGLRDEIMSLRSKLDLDDEERTPKTGESMAEFYARTSGYWNVRASEAVTAATTKEEEESKGAVEAEPLTQKELKREGFGLARERYEELRPVLERLEELELQQREAEEGRTSSGRTDDGAEKKKKSSSSKGGKEKKEKKRERRK